MNHEASSTHALLSAEAKTPQPADILLYDSSNARRGGGGGGGRGGGYGGGG
ncbi:MAG: hypothetical protein ACPIOQ_24515 [Promethearchaeia archaeon]